MTTYYQPLFNYLSNQHGLHLLESDMSEIINIVSNMKKQQQIDDLRFRIEQIESHLAEQHKGANFSKLNIPDSISDAPDYTHLLPEGYEFCSEEDAEKWVKVEYEAGWPLGIVVDIADKVKMDAIMYNHIKPSYRPIRPIQYKVTTHEIVDAVPDPYMPDWSKAPEGAVAHAWDANGKSFWYTMVIDKELTSFMIDIERSNAPTLPPDLDWKQSLRVKPSK
jgi:hypothetical protein